MRHTCLKKESIDLIICYPLHFRLKDAVTAEELHWSIPDADVLWKMMFQSLVNRQSECQLEVLDLTQFLPSRCNLQESLPGIIKYSQNYQM